MSNAAPIMIAASLAMLLAAGGYTFIPRASVSPACTIKGNIAIGSGQRIYHMPGQQHYTATTIRPNFGERWFCTEHEARAAGWRKARS